MRLILPIAVLALGLCSSCARLETVEECERVIELVNAQLSEITELASGSPYFEVAENDYEPVSHPRRGAKGSDPDNADDTSETPPEDAQTEPKPADPKDLSARYAQLAADLKTLDLKSSSLKRVVHSYSAMLHSASRALDRVTPRQLERPSKATKAIFDKVIKQERSVVQQLDRVCHPH